MNTADRIRVIRLALDIAIVVWAVLVVLLLTSCGTETRAEVETQKRIVTVTKEIRQEINWQTGEVATLETITQTTTDESGNQIGLTSVEVKPPQVAKLAGAAAALLTGNPAASKPVEAAVDWFTTMLAGGGTAATVAGGGYVALRREKRRAADLLEERDELERQRNEIIDGVEEAKARLKTIKIDEDRTAWTLLKTDLERKQSRDTIDAVRKQTL